MGVFARITAGLAAETAAQTVMIDANYLRAHRMAMRCSSFLACRILGFSGLCAAAEPAATGAEADERLTF